MTGSPTLSSLFQQKIVIGVGEMAVSRNPGFILSTYALGSCIGIAAYSAAYQMGGILHLMLPDSADFPEKSQSKPAMFADTGIPKFIGKFLEVGIGRSALKLYVAGGAAVLDGPDKFRIGERNIAATKRILSIYGFNVVGHAVGGSTNRTLHLNMEQGWVEMKSPLGNSKTFLI
jgi:chemotaxis protein CheD